MGSHELGLFLKGMPEVILAEISGETALTPHSARHLGHLFVVLSPLVAQAEPNFPSISQASRI